MGEKQNKYRVTFITASGIEQRTVLDAHNLPDCIRKVEGIMKDPAGYFTNDKKNNTYFTVQKQQAAYVQYELLFSGREIHMEKLKHLPVEAVQQVLQALTDPEVYALALAEVDLETRSLFYQHMSPGFRQDVERHRQERWEEGSMEAYQAQEMLLDTVTSIIRRN
ncbi:LysR family transcriptional regulator [Ectobacillus ponti]|uniref:LysR family transcriptional regulator n=1 Tax=Ectobacillus ponti TaxID=2961894 RepID=A0AA41X810_9BACI|nr:LysR family transcriptional regulator [Ectobacillus ponti]MCP8968853.1 LysR family transcriptional regulator [Ectobacillus ponti]